MLFLSRSWMIVGVAGVCLACIGCQSKTAEKPNDNKPAAARPASSPNERATAEPDSKAGRKAAKSKPQEPLPPPTIPKVTLSDELRAACLVTSGDVMPEGKLLGLDGKPHTLSSLCGKELTVVFVWTFGSSPRARLVATTALQDLAKEVAAPFADKGVSVIAVNVGDAPAAVGQALGNAGQTFANLLDPDGEYFAKLATDKKMPRVYLLDAQGRILWFDLEFRRNSREDLVQSIRVALGEL